MRWACSGFFGSPKAVIFFIAAASSGFSRSSRAIEAFWNHLLKSGTFERNVTIGPQVLAAPDPPEQHEDARGAARGRAARTSGIQAQKGTARS